MKADNIKFLSAPESSDALTNFIVHTISYNSLRSLINIILYILVLWIFILLLTKLLALYQKMNEKFIFLEITPPQSTEISSVSTTELFNLIHELISQNSFINKILQKQICCSFEVASSKDQGIRYFVHVPKIIASTLEKDLRSYVPGIKIKEASDYLPETILRNQRAKILEFKLAKHFVLPLDDQADLKKHDPLAYLTGNMIQLKGNDLIALQLILSPLSGADRRRIHRIRSLIALNRFEENALATNLEQTLLSFARLVEFVVQIVMLPLLLVAEFAGGHRPDTLSHSKTTRTVTPASKERMELIKSKINQPLFSTTIRALVISEKGSTISSEKGLHSSFASFLHSSGQSLLPAWKLPIKPILRVQQWCFQKRMSGKSTILSSSEVSALYHFPYRSNVDSTELLRVRSRELPAPLSLKKTDPNLDIVVGVNKYGNEEVSIGLTLEQRQKHMYVIGKTGMGKTTLLTNAIYQDMINGRGLAVFDPHGDMLKELIGIIPEQRRKDVIIFDPSDREWPIGLNLLSPGIDFTDKEDQEEWITSSVISVFKKITAKEYWGPRMDHILTNATLTALQTPNPSLYTLQRLLTDKEYQKKVAISLKDPVLKQFWNKEFALLGKMQLSSVTAPLTQRLGHFITTKMSRHILLQEKSTINMSQIMDEGKILLVNLSKGDLGEDQSFFFGTVLISIIWMAAYQRTKVSEEKRPDFFLYIDEFQNFATTQFSEIISEGRKFHLSLIASHQNIAQVEDPNILKVVAGNANSIVCLKASPDDEKFILPFMEPEVEKGDIVNLAPFHFFMKASNENSENAFSGITVPLEIKPSEETRLGAIDYSRNNFATPRIKVEEYLDKLFTGIPEERAKLKEKMKIIDNPKTLEEVLDPKAGDFGNLS